MKQRLTRHFALFLNPVLMLTLLLTSCSTFSGLPWSTSSSTTEARKPSPSQVQTTPTSNQSSARAMSVRPSPSASSTTKSRRQEGNLTNQRQDVLMYTMGLLGTGYRFGGKNPEAGLDCSGMVSFIYREATDYPLRGNAASMAKEGRLVSMKEVLPGDLVFFNTRGFANSHVGIFIGEGRFVHAPSTNGKIRVDRLDGGYFGKRFEEARTYFN